MAKSISHSVFSLFFSVAMLAGIPAFSSATGILAGSGESDEHPELASCFGPYASGAVFVVHDLGFDRWSGYHLDRIDQRHRPASTFKIAHALIALETGIIAGPDSLICWSGKQYPVAAWNGDQTLASAISNSCVWYFRETARRIGTARMQAWLERLGYGNAVCGPAIDSFWLDGDLRISPREQILFFEKLHGLLLPAGMAAQQTVRGLLLLESANGWALYGKTGLTQESTASIGWFVGCLERHKRLFTFALLVAAENPGQDFNRMRTAGVKAALRQLQMLP